MALVQILHSLRLLDFMTTLRLTEFNKALYTYIVSEYFVLQSHFLFFHIKSLITFPLPCWYIIENCHVIRENWGYWFYTTKTFPRLQLYWLKWLFFLFPFLVLLFLLRKKMECRNVKHEMNFSLDDQRIRNVTPRDSKKKISCWAQTKRRSIWSIRWEGRTQDSWPLIIFPYKMFVYRIIL